MTEFCLKQLKAACSGHVSLHAVLTVAWYYVISLSLAKPGDRKNQSAPPARPTAATDDVQRPRSARGHADGIP